jgi:hypothetical protein
MDGTALRNQFINSGAGSRLKTSRTPKLHWLLRGDKGPGSITFSQRRLAGRGPARLGRPGPTSAQVCLQPAGAVAAVPRRLIEQETYQSCAVPSASSAKPRGKPARHPPKQRVAPRRTRSARIRRRALCACRAPSVDARFPLTPAAVRLDFLSLGREINEQAIP